jgi:tRNA 2-thiouridine synthesizing protein A
VEEKIAVTVDARGLSCPLPVIRAKRALAGVEVGEVVQVLATDPGSVADFEAWTRSTGHRFLHADEAGAEYRFLLQRAL